ncbi:MAG: hypothetical protein GY749_39880 [Desulfobacteraceae bacterium]|nr:hypothetical protein [Desulfobacteraceae bacterium]
MEPFEISNSDFTEWDSALLVQHYHSTIRPTSGGVIKSKVLPGFQFRVQDLYDRPCFEEMAEDPVYKHFVLKKWQAERSRADEAEKKVGKAEETAEAEKKRALKLAEKLREMGIDPESL